MQYKVICIGAGPAGLTAAYLLSKEKVPLLVLEKDPVYVGGISRTVNHKGYLCDIGGHRFFSKSLEVEALWHEILGNDFIDRPRKSRIFYNGKFFDYPLKAFDALRKLGIFQSVRCVLSYVWVRCFPIKEPANFEEWMTNKFGKRLFSIFFKTYTEKVWGMKCSEISADWAAQRIKGLSLATAIRNAFLPQKDGKANATVKTLIDHFRYPRKGPGMMWDAAVVKIVANGGKVEMNAMVTGCHYDGAMWQVKALVNGAEQVFSAEHVITSNPLSEVIKHITPEPPPELRNAALSLNYRDFLIVGLVVKDKQKFDDNWIYIHDPSVKVGRIQNFKSWSPEMVPDPATNCYGMEYFCFEGDGLWTLEDTALVQLASHENIKLGLAERSDILEGFVIRQPKAYPVYDAEYKTHLQVIEHALKRLYPNLHPVGRNGMHRYNNQDHSMMTAMLTVKNILAGKEVYNAWNVNEDAEYHEEVKTDAAPAGRAIPARMT